MSQPIRPDTISIALCLSGIMPKSECVEEDWIEWTKKHLRKAIALCIKADPHMIYNHVPEELLRATVSAGQGQGKAFLLDVLEKAERGVPKAVLALRDQLEPEDSDDEDEYGVEYEDWYGYDPNLKGFEAACNYEDYWKDGGREGIAKGKKARERQILDIYLKQSWARALESIRGYVDNLPDWENFAIVAEARCKLLKAKLAEFGKSSKWDESTRGAGAADQLYALPALVADSTLQGMLDLLFRVLAWSARTDALLLAAARLIARGNEHPNAANYCFTLLQFISDDSKTRHDFGAKMKAFARKSVHTLCGEVEIVIWSCESSSDSLTLRQRSSK